ncbi:MAG: transglutaminase family protein [Candidatus Heimdallarchaeota archaeon]|nr:MAG: transglutaminase family protein [Candidatus Heimdallarchaeota archaeon]
MVLNEYLDPTFFIDSESDIVVNLANELSSEHNKKVDLAIATFNYVRDNIKYTIDVTRYETPDDMKGSTTIEKKVGFCIPKSVALVALYRANQIPARLHFADIINHRIPPHIYEILQTNVMVFHGYAEVYLGKWIKLTPSFQTPLCDRHNFPVCTFDGVNDATFKPYDNAGNLFVEYISDRGTYADLPYDEIFTTFREYYGYP